MSKQYVRNPDGSLELTRPKTENSVRLVSIPQTAVDLLIQEHSKHPDSPYMFPSPLTGEMYHPDSVVNLHKKILKDAGLEHLRFHDLRHTFATTALQNGVDVKTVSSMLGHFDAGFTLRTYTHATRQKQDEAAADHGQLYGTGPVRTERKIRRTGRQSSCPALLCPLVPLSHFRVWVTVWVRNFWPTRKATFCNKKSPKTEVFGDFWSCYPDSNWGPHPYQGCALPTEL